MYQRTNYTPIRLKRAEIIPTVIQDFLPSLTVNVTWPTNKTADLGNTIKPKHLQDVPFVTLEDGPTPNLDRERLLSMEYTIAMTDPDAPSRDNPEWSEMCHWIATGITINIEKWTADSEKSKPKKLKEIMEYKPPGPPPKTGKHRYVILVFAPKNGTTSRLDLTKPNDRQHWGTGKERHGVRDWAEENGLVPIGIL